MSHFETERPAGFPDQAPTENVIGAGSTRQPVSSFHTKPVLVDLFCGAGGCTKGYQQAGFYVIGVDSERQPNYCGDQFVQADALEFIRDNILSYAITPVAVHASPPCPAYSLASHFHGVQADHPDLVGPTRELLQQTALPWVMENVEGSPLRRDLVLCGEMFDLRVHRHRVFECEGWMPFRIVHRPHLLKGAKHNCHIEEGHARLVAGNMANRADAADAMGIDWPMTTKELANAIPPEYTRFIGEQLLRQISRRVVIDPEDLEEARRDPKAQQTLRNAREAA